MAVSQYIGARYVPVFADPYDWDDTREYEPLTIVYSNGNSYTSRQYVPKGIPLTDESYWVLTGNYNAQVEQYRKETKEVSDKYDGVVKTAGDALALAHTNEQDIASNDAELAGTSDSGLKTLITEETARAKSEESSIDSKLIAETTRATKAEDTLSNSISVESNRAQGAEKENKDAIDAEVKRAKEADENLKYEFDSHFPINPDDVKDGSITAPKLSVSAIQSILQGYTVKYFDSTDTSADNTGLSVPSGTKLSGFYIVELGILVINQFEGAFSALGNPETSNYILPSYVPNVSSIIQVSNGGIMYWNNNSSFLNWSGVRIGSRRNVFPNSQYVGSFSLFGNLIVYLKPYAVSDQTANYSNAVAYNQML